MGIGKKGRGYDEWYKLIHFRWKALIRSPEFLTFYNDKVKKLLDKKAALNKEQATPSKKLTLDDYLDSFTQPANTNLLYNERPDIEQAYNTIEHEERVLLEKAKKQFGLIMSFVEALLPVDIDKFPFNKDRWITFKDYLPAMPDNHHYRELIEDSVIQEIKNVKGSTSITIHGITSDKRLLLIDATDMPLEMIIAALRKRLGKDDKKRKDRKEFEKWEEAFKVWDINQHTQNLLIAAKIMGWKYNRKGIEYTDEELRSLADKKIRVAKNLIILAGKGKFKTL